jgi:hypothetical protein
MNPGDAFDLSQGVSLVQMMAFLWVFLRYLGDGLNYMLIDLLEYMVGGYAFMCVLEIHFSQ